MAKNSLPHGTAAHKMKDAESVAVVFSPSEQKHCCPLSPTS